MVRMKKAGLLAAAGILSGCLAMTSPGAGYDSEKASSFSSRFGLSGTAYDPDADPEADAANGPGVIADTGSTLEEGKGPGVEEVTMGERYHAEYGLYEQSIKSRYFLYSNVSNGGITDQPVYLEIPAGVEYTAEKDGVPFYYVSGQRVAERGTYVIYITAVEDKNVPLAEQKEYRTVFRFRIDQKIPETGSAQGQAAGGLPSIPGSLDTIWETTAAAAIAETESAAQLPEETEASAEPQEEPEYAEGAGAQTDGAQTPESESGPQDGEAVPASGEIKRSQVFKPENSMYQVTLENGFTFMSNVPEGMVTTQAVRIRADEPYTLLLGGEELEAETQSGRDRDIRAYGSYQLVSGEYEFSFEITDSYVNRDSFKAPVGLRITEAEFSGEALDVGNGTEIAMSEDGQYTFAMEGGAGETFSVSLERDTLAPEITVEVGRQNAVITYLAKDIAGITLSRNGSEPYAFSGTAVTDTGNYILTVTDRAGNVTVSEFSLRYHMNFYALTAIILCVAGIAAIVVILVRKKKNLTVR